MATLTVPTRRRRDRRRGPSRGSDRARPVDELRIFRYPVIVGGGTQFLPPVTDDIALDLIETSRQELVARVFLDEYLPEVVRQTPLTSRGRFDRESTMEPHRLAVGPIQKWS